MIIQRLFSLDSGSYTGTKREIKLGKGIAQATVTGGLVGAALGGLGTMSKKGAALGGLIGAGLNAVTKWLSNIAEKSIFNSQTSKRYNSYSFLRQLDSIYTSPTEDSESTTTNTETNTDETTGKVSSKTVTVKTNIRPKRQAEGLVYVVDGDPKKYVINILFSGFSAALYINSANPREINIINEVLDKYCNYFKNADYTSENIGKGTYFVDLKLIEDYEYWVPLDFIKHGFKLNIITGQRFGIKNK